MAKVKNQHYVPQCYLRQFCSDQSDHLFVFDKKTRRSWRRAINNVAAEGYFYDLSFKETLDDDTHAFLNSHNVCFEQLKDDQTIEKYLATQIENRYATLLSSLVTRYDQLTTWTEKNCFFISYEEKKELSNYLMIQMLRTRATRDMMLDSADCLQQVIVDMGFDKTIADRVALTEEQAGNIQGSMLIDAKSILKGANLLNQLTWLLCINRTSQLLFTSDSPISRKAHKKHPFLGMTGLASPGVEICIPISPNLLLLMVDGDYHTLLKNLDRNWEVMSLDNVRHYNARCVYQSHRFIYSKTDDFSLVSEIAQKDPTVFDSGVRDIVSWGDKKYKPRER